MWPVYSEPYLMISQAQRGGSQLYDLSGDDETSPRLVWTLPVLSNQFFSHVVADGFAYGFDLSDGNSSTRRGSHGSLRCVELKTGQVRWSSDRVGYTNVLEADGKLILLTDTGELVLARTNPQRYQELARTRVFAGTISWTPATLSHGRLYVRNKERAACLFLGESSLFDGETLPGPITRFVEFDLNAMTVAANGRTAERDADGSARLAQRFRYMRWHSGWWLRLQCSQRLPISYCKSESEFPARGVSLSC